MSKMGRPVEKTNAEKITLYLDEDARKALLNLSKRMKCSRSKVVENLAIAADAEEGKLQVLNNARLEHHVNENQKKTYQKIGVVQPTGGKLANSNQKVGSALSKAGGIAAASAKADSAKEQVSTQKAPVRVRPNQPKSPPTGGQ